jgi:hypothetical protein
MFFSPTKDPKGFPLTIAISGKTAWHDKTIDSKENL